MQERDKDIIVEQIVAFLDGRASKDEIRALREWVEQSEQNKVYFSRMKNIFEMSGRKLEPAAIRTDVALQKTLGRVSSKRKTFRHSVGVWLQRAAAVLFIPVLIASIHFYAQSRKNITTAELADVNFVEMKVATGVRSFVTLPDSTRVWLNSGSFIRYPDRFTGNQRTVFVQGEAYFEVTASVENPFVVNTPTMQVRATGTKFHVADFEGSLVKEVSLLSGRVAVGKIIDNQNNVHLLDLEPGQHLEYNVSTQSTHLTEGDVYKHHAWKDNKIIFRNDLMSDVVRRLSHSFGVEIELQGDELKSYRYRATFEDEALHEILSFLKLSAPIDFKEIKRQRQEDGTYSKPKIVIFHVK